MKRKSFDANGGNDRQGTGGRTDPDTTHGDKDIVSTEGMDGNADAGDDTFSDEGLDQPGGTSGAESGTAGLARNDD